MKPSSFDHKVRIVSLENLAAMASRLSGMSHRFTVLTSGKARVQVEYSNPDEYGNPHPIRVEYGLLPIHGKENPAVVLSALRCIGSSDDSLFQAFDQLEEYDQLWPTDKGWRTTYEILVERYPAWAVSSYWKDQCTQVWTCHGSEFKDCQSAREYAVQNMRALQDAQSVPAMGSPSVISGAK